MVRILMGDTPLKHPLRNELTFLYFGLRKRIAAYPPTPQEEGLEGCSIHGVGCNPVRFGAFPLRPLTLLHYLIISLLRYPCSRQQPASSPSSLIPLLAIVRNRRGSPPVETGNRAQQIKLAFLAQYFGAATNQL